MMLPPFLRGKIAAYLESAVYHFFASGRNGRKGPSDCSTRGAIRPGEIFAAGFPGTSQNASAILSGTEGLTFMLTQTSVASTTVLGTIFH
jgi:hypothetical protein